MDEEEKKLIIERTRKRSKGKAIDRSISLGSKISELIHKIEDLGGSSCPDCLTEHPNRDLAKLYSRLEAAECEYDELMKHPAVRDYERGVNETLDDSAKWEQSYMSPSFEDHQDRVRELHEELDFAERFGTKRDMRNIRYELEKAIGTREDTEK